MNKRKHITLGSLFDGIGGFPYAGSFFGIEPLWASEIMPQAVSVTQRHLPGMAHVGDITKLDGGKLPPVDIITFGSPCQGLSLAGRRLGLADERSGLFTEAIRIIDEMREATNGQYPCYAIWENVPGALSSGSPHGSDFRAVLEAFAKAEVPVPRSGKWANAGMVRGNGVDLAWCVYNAQYFGTAQRRRRIFLVCDFGGGCAGEILFVPQSLHGYFAAGGTPRQGPAAYAQRGADDASRIGNQPHCLNPWDTQQSRVFTEDGTSPTLAGADGGGGRNPAGLVITKPCDEGIVCLNDQGGDSMSVEKAEISPTLRSETHGNLPIVSFREAYPINMQTATRHMELGEGTGFGVGEDGDPAYTLQQAHSHAVAVGVHQNGNGDVNTSETAYTLNTNGNATGRNSPLVCSNIHAFSLDSAESNSMKSANPHSGCREVETARTIDTTNPCPSKNQGGIAVVEAQAYGITAKGNGECIIRPECHFTLTGGGGMPGQGYPAAMIAHPKVSGTLCASGAGLSRPGGMASETDLCVVVPDMAAIPINDKATRYNGGGDTRNNDGAGNGLGIGKPGDPAPTMTAGDRHAVAAYCLQGSMIGRQDHNGPAGNGINEDVSFTLNTVDRHVVFSQQRSDAYIENGVTSTQTAHQSKDNTDLVVFGQSQFGNYSDGGATLRANGGDNGGGSENLVIQPPPPAYIVRRLLPVECERLQGYPDGWTEFGHDGKTISDTARYMMLGNSVAVPCVAYILQAIAREMRKEEDHAVCACAEGFGECQDQGCA